MGSLVLAFSLDSQIEQIGSLAGLAAILGLAVLSLLYFAQAREVRRLREWAGRAPERDAELQQRVAEDAARRTSGAAPVPAARPATAAAQAAGPKPASAPATAAGQTAIAKPGTPVPAGAPAATGATVTKPGAPSTAAVPSMPGAGPTAADAAPGAVTGAKPGGPTSAPAAAKPATPPAQSPAKPPVPAAAPPSVPPKPAIPPVSAQTAAGQVRPRRTVPLGATPSSATASARRDEPEERDRLFSPRAVAATALTAVLVVGILFVTGIVGGSGDDDKDKSPATATTTTETSPASGGPAAAEPADVPVAVLNGTTVTGLARQAADRLEARGYPVAAVTDAADQQQQVSLVGYADGFEDAAKRVARLVGISAAQVQALDPSTAAIAGDGVSVVVTMGLDKAE
ncbi:MAG: LytR C-terminal domain-containing protein [Solirubrobacteraceae bacterium]